MPAHGSSSVGSGPTTALPSGLSTDDLLFAVVSVEGNAGATINNVDSGVWTQIGSTTNQGAGSFALCTAFFWARKTAGNLTSAPTWTSSAGTPSVSYERVTSGITSGSPFTNTSGTGYAISTGADASLEYTSITPGTANTFILGMQAAWVWQLSSSTDFANERADAGTSGPHAIYDDGTLASGSTGTLVVTCGGSGEWSAIVIAVLPAAATDKDQEGFRFYNDNGDEDASTALAAQDTDITQPLNTNTRLRVLINAGGDPGSAQFELRFKKSTDSIYQPVPTSPALTVAFGAIGAAPVTNATSTIDIAYPTVAAGDLILVAIASRLGSTSIDAEGFSALANNTENVATSEGTAGTEAADAGGIRVTVFYKIADGTETGNVTFSNSGTATLSKTGRMLSFTKPWWATWDLADCKGKDSSGGTSYSAAMGSDPGIAIGDILVAATALNTDAAAWSAEDITGTGLASALTTEHQEGVSTGGNDVELVITTHDVTAALTSGVPTFVATASTGTPEGATVITRIRATGAPAIMVSPSTHITASGENTTARLTAPSGKTTSDFVAGRISDDENPLDAIDITVDDYTEVEWCLKAQSPAADTDIYQFRVYAGGSALDTYSLTPQWTIGTAGGGVDGTLSKTLDAATVSATGSSTISGVLTKTLATATVAATGTSPISGDLTKTLAAATVAATGTSPISGVLTQNLASATLVATGGAAAAVGELAVTLAAATVTAAGTSPISGALTRTLADATVASTGQVPVVATLAKTLAAATVVSAATSPISGTLTRTLAAATVTATGTSPITGTLTKTLDAATLVATSGSGTGGSLSVTLASATVVSAATSTISGQVAKTLAAATVAATATAPIVGQAAVTLASAIVTSTGVSSISGIAAVTLAGVTVSAAATSLITAQLSVTLAPAVASSEAGSLVSGLLNATLASAVLFSSGLVTDVPEYITPAIADTIIRVERDKRLFSV